MTTRDQEEQDLRIDQMTLNIEKIREDLEQFKRDQVNRKGQTSGIPTSGSVATAFRPFLGPQQRSARASELPSCSEGSANPCHLHRLKRSSCNSRPQRRHR